MPIGRLINLLLGGYFGYLGVCILGAQFGLMTAPEINAGLMAWAFLAGGASLISHGVTGES